MPCNATWSATFDVAGETTAELLGALEDLEDLVEVTRDADAGTATLAGHGETPPPPVAALLERAQVGVAVARS